MTLDRKTPDDVSEVNANYRDQKNLREMLLVVLTSNPSKSVNAYWFLSIAGPLCSDTQATKMPDSTSEAMAWDEAFATMADPSGRAMRGVHQNSY